MISPPRSALLAALMLLLSPKPATALPAAEAAAARKLIGGVAPAIVSVEIVTTIKITVGGKSAPPQEERMEANGTVLAADGLTVTSLTEVDPHGRVEAAFRNLRIPGDQRPEIGATEYKNAKLRMADGTEVPARVVYKDPDLDLVFIYPTPNASAPKQSFAFVSLEQPSAPTVLDDYFIVSRASKSLQRVPEIRATTFVAITEKPKRLFLPTVVVFGCPVLDSDGHVVGLGLAHIVNGRPLIAAGRPNSIVLPAADLADELKQARIEAAKPPPAPPSTEDEDAPPAAPAPANRAAPAVTLPPAGDQTK